MKNMAATGNPEIAAPLLEKTGPSSGGGKTGLRQRLPDRAELGLIYSAVSVPIHTWAVLIFFHALPAYLLRMPVTSAASILAYVLSLALIESLLVTAVLVFVCLALPEKYFKRYCVPQAAWLIWVFFLWTLYPQFQNSVLERLEWNFTVYYAITILWAVTFVAFLFSGSLTIRRKLPFRDGLRTAAERLSILSALYLALDLCGIIIVLGRNLFA